MKLLRVSLSNVNKFCVMLVMFAFVLSVGVRAAEVWQGDGSQNTPYIIDSVSGLKALSYNVKSGNNYDGVYFELVKDLDLSTIGDWTPIGNATYPFKGVFDGGNHTIKNMTVNTSDTYAGLFGLISGKAIICHVTLEDGSVKTSGDAAGGIAGSSMSDVNKGACIIYDCTNNGCTVVATAATNSDTSAVSGIGGIVGSAVQYSSINSSSKNTNHIVIEYCINNASVYATCTGVSYVGGVIGRVVDASTGVSTGSYEDGEYSRIRNCINKGAVGGTGSVYGGTSGTGGIVGYLVQNCRMYNCSNYGSVGSCSTSVCTGGLCGAIAATDSRVANCYNSGVVTLKDTTVASGGLSGRVVGYLLNCYNAAERTNTKMGTLAGTMGTNAVIKGCSTLSSYAFVYNKTLSTSNYNSSNKTLEKAISLTSPYGLNTKIYSSMSAFTYVTAWENTDNKFAANTVTIELYTDGTDTPTDTIEVSEGSTYSTLKNPSDTSFIGWYTTPTGGSHQITSDSVVALSLESSVTEGKKLYARYSSSDSVAENTLLGDYDGDKAVTKKDAALLLKYISDNGNVEYNKNLDMNGDQNINILDVIQIMKKIEQ